MTRSSIVSATRLIRRITHSPAARPARRLLWRSRRPAERTADVVIVPALHVLAPLCHLSLELLVAQRHRVPEVAEHLRNGPTPVARPVSRIGNVAVRRAGVERANQMNNRALRQQRRAVVGEDILLDPVMVVSDAVQRLDVVTPNRLQ